MKTKSFKYLIIAVLSVILNSCKQNYCQFDLSDKGFISFRLNDTVYYNSNTNDTLILVIIDFCTEDEVSGYHCYAGASYATNECNGISIKESTIFLDSLVTFGKDKGYDLLSSQEIKNDFRQHFSENKQINGVTYSGVLEVEDLSGNRRIDRFTKVNYHGIIELHDKITDLTWHQILKASEKINH
jgi:hypothetical protein